MASAAASTRPTVSEDNWALLRIWLPRNAAGKFIVAHLADSPDTSPGHATLEFLGGYASFWPDLDSGKKGGGKSSAKSGCRGKFLDDFHAPDFQISH